MLHAWRENVPGHRIRSVWWPLDVASPQKKKGKKTKNSHCSSLLCSKRVVHHFLYMTIQLRPLLCNGTIVDPHPRRCQFHASLPRSRFLDVTAARETNFMPDKVLVIETTIFFITSVTKDNIFFSRHCLVLKGEYFDITIYMTGFDTRCLHVLCRQPSLRRKNSSSPGHPWHLWLVNHPPPTSSATSNMIMNQSIHLAGVANGEKSLALNCFLTWDCNQSDKISPSPVSPIFDTKKASHPPTVSSGPKLSDRLSGFFWLPWLDARVQEKT